MIRRLRHNTSLCGLAAAGFFLLVAACSAGPDPVGGAPVPKTQARLSPRVFGEPECSVTPQNIKWPNPFKSYPSTLPFYNDSGAIPVGGQVDGVDVPPVIWFEQRLWTLMGMSPSDASSTVAAHPSTVVGYTWNAVQAVPAGSFTQTDLGNLMAAFADVDPVDSSAPTCSYGATVNVAWDPICPSNGCITFKSLTTAPTGGDSTPPTL
jgi:hypothetical protein